MAKKKRRFAPTDLGVTHVDTDGDGINDGVQVGDEVVSYGEEIEVETEDRDGEVSGENTGLENETVVETVADTVELDHDFEPRTPTEAEEEHEDVVPEPERIPEDVNEDPINVETDTTTVLEEGTTEDQPEEEVESVVHPVEVEEETVEPTVEEIVETHPDVSIVETPAVEEKTEVVKPATPVDIFRSLVEERLKNFMSAMSPGVANTEKSLQDHQMELNSIFMSVIFAKEAKMFEAGFLAIYQSFRANLNLVFPVYRRFAGLMTMPKSRMTDEQLNLHNTLIDLFCNLADDDFRPRMASRYNFSMLTRYLTDPFALNRVIEEVKEMIS